MRKLALIALILAVVGMVIPAYCAETKTETKGSVTKIDLVKETITIKPEKGEGELVALYKEVKVTKGGKAITLAEIKVTDKVKVTKKGDAIETIDVEVIPVPVKAAPSVTTKSGAPVTTQTGIPVTAKPTAETKK